MYRFWTPFVEPLCQATGVRRVLEVGIGEGHMTRLLIAYAKRTGGRVESIDPDPACDMSVLGAEGGDSFRFHQDLSLHVIPALSADLVLLDGEHNWYTVLGELRALERWQTQPMILLHDVGWPYGRRDMYYDEKRIPPEVRQPSAYKGMHVGLAGLAPEGGLNADLQNSLTEGGARNGVLTALEDFLQDEGHGWLCHRIPTIHGLAWLIPPRLRNNTSVLAIQHMLAFNPVQQSFLETTEAHRLRELVAAASLHEEQKKWERERVEREKERVERERERVEWERERQGWASERTLHDQEQYRMQQHIDACEKKWRMAERALWRLERTRSVRWTSLLRRWSGAMPRWTRAALRRRS